MDCKVSNIKDAYIKRSIEKLGTSSRKTFHKWLYNLTNDRYALAKEIMNAEGLTWQGFYEKYIYDEDVK